MSSDSELSSAIPDDDVLKSALQNAVRSAFAAGKGDECSVNSARATVEAELGLDSGFFKSHDHWNTLSKTIIKETAAEPNASPAKPTKPRSKVTSTKKRKVAAKEKPRKRRKEDSDEEVSDEEVSEGAGSDTRGPAKKAAANDSDSSKLSEPPVDVSEAEQSTTRPAVPEDSESELSDVKDEPAPKKRGKRSSDSTKKAPKASKTKTVKPSKDADLSPDEQEIKRLQGWLVKCGLRKLWHRELAHCDSSKAKIKHLKGMLEDVGMTGRYSQEKATAIKEQRELAADLEAVQEGNKTWGMASGSEDEKDESDSASRPVRRRGVASRFVDFGDDEDDE